MAIETKFIQTARTLLKGGMEKEQVIESIDLMMKNSNGSIDAFADRMRVLHEIESYIESKESMANLVRDYINATEGDTTRREIQHELHLTTPATKRNLTTILGRLCIEGIIEPTGKKNGQYRKIVESENRIDFMSASDANVEIVMPFGLEQYVDIYPKNIVIIAGAPDAGKTAFLLNLAGMNMNDHNVFYFSSEMGEQELRLRLSKFDHPLEEFKKINWIERNTDFQDVIRPNDLNIIDFLEVHEDFWKVGLMIKQIFDKLDKGVAFIALQKDKYKEFGLGGSRGLEKARLYLTMNPNELTIVKAKNWRDPLINPNNKIFDFSLVQGHKFVYKGIRE